MRLRRTSASRGMLPCLTRAAGAEMQGRQSVTGAGERQPGGGRLRGRLGGGTIPPQSHHDAARHALRRAAARGGASLCAAHLRGATSVRAAGALTALDGISIWSANISRSLRGLHGRPPWWSRRRRRLLGTSINPSSSLAWYQRLACGGPAGSPAGGPAAARVQLCPGLRHCCVSSLPGMRPSFCKQPSARLSVDAPHGSMYMRRRSSASGDMCNAAARDMRRTRDSRFFFCKEPLARAAHQLGPIPNHRSFKTEAVAVGCAAGCSAAWAPQSGSQALPPSLPPHACHGMLHRPIHMAPSRPCRSPDKFTGFESIQCFDGNCTCS